MPPRSATWDKIQWVKVTIARQMVNGVFIDDASATIDWSVSTQDDRFPQHGSGAPTLNASQQTQANGIANAALTFAKNQEGIP